MAREMKDSGVEWIGEIPREWEVVKLKRIAELYVGNSIKDEEKPKYLDNINAIPYISTKDIEIVNSTINYENGMYTKIGDSNFRVAKKDSILLCIEGGSAGRKISYLLQDVSFVNKLCCFEGKINVRKKFLYYFLKSESFKSEFFLNISGLIGGVSQNLLKNFFTILPPLEEQEKIANYLDKKVSDIDLIIEKTKITIEDYKKYKQSIITEAVTKGINPNVEMKDSGIEWIGEIPKHWKKINPKALFFQRKEKAKKGERQLTASQKYGVIYQDDFMKKEGVRVTVVQKDFDILKHVEPNDFVISMRSFQGGLEYSELAGSISSAYVMLIPNLEKVTPRFFKYFFKSSKYINALQSTSNLVRDGQAMRYSNFTQLYLVEIPLEEQNQIAEYLDKKTSEIDTLITKKEALITELEEYKKSLIYECVTGKKEII